MKTIHSKFIIGSLVLATIFSCKKESAEMVGSEKEVAVSNVDLASEAISDSISTVATMQVKDKQFIKKASVDMEVKDVYDATVYIEKSVKDLGGFVTNSNLRSNVVSEETFNTSDENAMLIKKYQTENTMEVRVPTAELGTFLQLVNDKKLFLNSRIINAEDVTANIKYAEMEAKRIDKTGENIATLKNNEKKVDRADNNMNEANYQKLQDMTIADNLKYSTIQLYIKEPKLRIAEIPVINTKNMDNKYKFNFFYDAKNAFVEGYYLIQLILLGLLKIWPIIVIAGVVIYFLRKRNSRMAKQKKPISEP